MNSNFNCHTLIIAGLLSAFCLGCTPDNLSDIELPIPAASEYSSDSKDDFNSITVNEVPNETSPAARTFQLPAADTEPEIVCQRFLELLNAEDANNFELLLTSTALNVANQLKFHLPPIAEANAKFSVNEPTFGTIREKLCFVESNFEGSDASENSTMTMMMKKTRSGWRIAGMMVDNEENGTQNLLSFENAKDVLQIKSSVENLSTASIEN